MDSSLCYWLSSEGYECSNPARDGFCYSCYKEKSYLYQIYKTNETYLCSLFEAKDPPTLGVVIPLLHQVILQREQFTTRLHPELHDYGHEYHILKLTQILQNYIHHLSVFLQDLTEVHKCMQTILSNPFASRDIDSIKGIVENYLSKNSLFVFDYETSITRLPDAHLRLLWRDNHQDLYYGGLEEFARINNIPLKRLKNWDGGSGAHQLVGVTVRNYLKYLVIYESAIKISKAEDIVSNLPPDTKRIVVLVAGKSYHQLQLIKTRAIPKGTVLIYCASRLGDLRGVITSHNVFVVQPEVKEIQSSKIESICMMCVLVHLHYNIDKSIAFHIVKGAAALVGELALEDREVKEVKGI